MIRRRRRLSHRLGRLPARRRRRSRYSSREDPRRSLRGSFHSGRRHADRLRRRAAPRRAPAKSRRAGCCRARRARSSRRPAVRPWPARTHAEANATSKKLGVGINQQTFHLFPKMREVDELLRSRPKLKRIVYEAHPELAFARMNGGKPVLSKKRQPDGYAERRRLLAEHGFSLHRRPPARRGARRHPRRHRRLPHRPADRRSARRRGSAPRARATATACR